MSVTAPQVKFISASVVFNSLSPFNQGSRIKAVSAAGTTLYGANHPGSGTTTKFQSFKQIISGNKHFLLTSGTVNAPQNTVSGALTAANQLRVVVLVNGVPPAVPRARGDQVVPATSFIVAAGGGTAAADATLIIKGTTAADLAAGSVLMSVASSGANTKTILVGDKLNIAGDPTDYFCTETSQALNGTTEVEVSITPPLQAACLANAVVTVTAGSGYGILLADAPAVGATVEVWVLDAGDIETMTGGAMTAGREYDIECKSVFHAAGALTICKL